MAPQYENEDLVKIQPSYREEVENTKNPKKTHKKSKKKYTKKQRNKLIKYKILRNILPMYDTAIIRRRACDF